MATPNVVVTVTDFLTAPFPSNLVGYLCAIESEANPALNKSGFTDSIGEVTFSSVTPGRYRLRIFGLGIMDLSVAVGDDAGPLDMIDLVDSGQIFGGNSGDLLRIDHDGTVVFRVSDEIQDIGRNSIVRLGVQQPPQHTDGVAFTEIYSTNEIVGSRFAGMAGVVQETSGIEAYATEDGPVLVGSILGRALFLLDPSGWWGGGPTPYVFSTGTELESGNIVEFKNNTTAKAAIDFAGKLTLTGAVQTAAPTTGTAGAWKLGIKVDAVTTLDEAHYLQVDVGGTLYKLALVTSA